MIVHVLRTYCLLSPCTERTFLLMPKEGRKKKEEKRNILSNLVLESNLVKISVIAR